MAQSAIAALPQAATTESAQAPVKHDFKDSVQTCTGQYLFDRFVNDDKETVSKVGAARLLAETVDMNTFKGALKDMLELAEKQSNGDKKSATYCTAKVRASELRTIYGACKYAMPAMQALGYSTETGYGRAVIMARQALKNAEMKWDGGHDSAEAKEKRAQERARRAENKLMQQAMQENERQAGESLADFTARCMELVQQKLDAEIADEEAKQIEAIARAVIAKNPEIAAQIADEIYRQLQTQ